MKVFKVLLWIWGILFAAAFITGIRSVEGSSGEPTLITHFHGWHRLLPFLGAVVCFTWLFGIIKRQMWGWHLGCAVFAGGVLNVIVVGTIDAFGSSPVIHSRWLVLSAQAVYALIIFLILTKWWIPKKQEFH